MMALMQWISYYYHISFSSSRNLYSQFNDSDPIILYFFRPANLMPFLIFGTCGRNQVTTGHVDQGGAPLTWPSVPWRHNQERTNERVGPAPDLGSRDVIQESFHLQAESGRWASDSSQLTALRQNRAHVRHTLPLFTPTTPSGTPVGRLARLG